MLQLRSLVPILAGTLGVVLAAPFNASLTTSSATPAASCEVASNVPLPPDRDCFYRPPQGWETKKPGTVLSSRSAIKPPIAGYSAYNILYRTTDSNEKPTYAVTTVFAPNTVSKPHSLVSYQHNYNSADVNDSPSFKIYNDTQKWGPIEISPTQVFVQSYLQRGWFVNLPDFEGPLAAFGAGHMAGHATLDSIRATLSMIYAIGMPKPMGSDPAHPKVAMYGYSGGAFATEWAAELKSTYAPELDIAGAGTGGLFPNAIDTISKLDAGLLRPLIQGIATMHDEAQSVVIGALGQSTWSDAVKALKKASSTDLRNTILPHLTSSPIVAGILNRDVSLGRIGVPKMPLLIHRADGDEYSTTADSIKLRDDYCRNAGAAVYLHINPMKKDFVLNNASPHIWEGVIASGFFAGLSPDLRYYGEVLDLVDDMLKGTFPTSCVNIVTAEWSEGKYGPRT